MFYNKDDKIFFKDFAEDALNEDGTTFRVIFDDNFQENNPFNSIMSVNGRDISISVKNSDIGKLRLKNKGEMVIRDQLYSIKNIKINQDGISDILLQIVEDE